MRKRNNKKTITITWTFFLLAMITTCIGILSSEYVLGRKNEQVYDDINVSITSFDGLVLNANESIQSDSGHRWALLIHSYGADHSMMNSYAAHYHMLGYNTLAPDLRAHGSSEGHFIGMGYLDKEDILKWIHYILDQDPDAEIVLHGISMGAAAIMQLSDIDELSSTVSSIIEDSGYSSASNYLTYKFKRKFRFPSFPILQITDVMARIRAGYWISDASPLKKIANSKIPILFIHGTNDQTVPVEQVYQLYNAADCPKKLIVIDNAGHGECMSLDANRYWSSIIDWLNNNDD